MKNILIDTDVILDFFFDRKPFSDNSAAILSLCETNKIEGYVTPVIISNLYYILRRENPHQKVISGLKQLINIIHVLKMDEIIVHKALDSEFKDFEDALQNYTAVENSDIDVIITRNTKDFKKSEIGVMLPEYLLKLVENE